MPLKVSKQGSDIIGPDILKITVAFLWKVDCGEQGMRRGVRTQRKVVVT